MDEEPSEDPWNDPDVRLVSADEVERWEAEERARRVRETLGAWAHVAALAGALLAVFLVSWELALFVYPMTVWVVGRGLAHVITDEGTVSRLLFYGLTPLAGLGGLLVAYAAWRRWWVAALLGGLAAIGGNLLAKRLFRRVAFEERMEPIRGWGAGP